MTIRLSALLCLLALATSAWAEEPPASGSTTPTDAPRAWTRLDLPGTPVAVAPGRASGTLLFATDQAQLMRHVEGKGVTWRADLGGDPADRIVTAPRGDLIVAATETELVAVSRRDGSLLWRAKRPVAFGLAPDGAKVFTLSKHGDIAELAATTGKEIATRKAADKRGVVMASVHPGSGLAVLGVADG